MNTNFPNREAIVVRDHELRVVRRLPSGADVRIRAGERVTAEHVIARTDPKSTAVRISVAEQLSIAPPDAAKYLMKPVGSTFAAGEALARARKGLRNVIVASPVAGTLLALDADTGVALLAPGGSGEIRALVPGDIEFVDGKQSVSIRTVGSRLFGVIGIGPAVGGRILIAASSASDELQVAGITPEFKGRIVVGGAWAGAAAIKKLIEVGASGLITGGLLDRELAASVGGASDDRLAPWRMGPGESTIGQEMSPNLALMATEGFGNIPIHAAVFALLNELDGQEAVLMTATRMTGFLSRPQLVVANTDLLDEDAPGGSASLRIDSHVRLVDQSSIGQTGIVKTAVKRTRRGDGNLLDVVDVEFANGQFRQCAVANLEIVA